MPKKAIDLTGQKFGLWLVLKQVDLDKGGHTQYLCRCRCGRERIVQVTNLRNGYSKGCQSCQISRKNTKHGFRKTRLYSVWVTIIQRCENRNDRAYRWYGGRGIGVCSKWRNDFMAFRQWAVENGYKEGLSIDRIDNDGDYKPDNCQFITRSENVLKAWNARRLAS